MSIASGTASLITSMGLAVVLVGICVLVHYETLRLTSIVMPKLSIRPRKRILFVMGAAFFAHSLEIWIYGVGYWLIANYLAIGDIAGEVTGAFPEYIYFSTVSYTSLGLGDLYPTGALRLLTGVEALLGLAMIGWTASFTLPVHGKILGPPWRAWSLAGRFKPISLTPGGKPGKQPHSRPGVASRPDFWPSQADD